MERPRHIEGCRQVFIKEYGTRITSIVNLGDRFAVAYLDQSDTKIEGVDIYDISGVKQRTFTDNIEGLRDLAVTPDKGTLVAVCGEGGGSYTIREIDPVRGRQIRSTPQFQLDGRVWRFDVCDGQQFVILHGGDDKVSLVDEEGSVVLTEVKSDSWFISCGGRHVFLSRGRPGHYVDVYEITEDRHLKHIATSQHFDYVSDLSATAAGEVTVTCQRGERYCLGRSIFKDNKFSKWKYKHVDSRVQWFVSVGGDHVVVVGDDNNDRMRILRVFEEEGNETDASGHSASSTPTSDANSKNEMEASGHLASSTPTSDASSKNETAASGRSASSMSLKERFRKFTKTLGPRK